MNYESARTKALQMARDGMGIHDIHASTELPYGSLAAILKVAGHDDLAHLCRAYVASTEGAA